MARLGAFLALFATLCATPGLAQDPGSLTQVTLQLKWRHQFQFAGYYAALDQGYYADAGLNVRILEGGENIDVYDAVESGAADFGICGAEILIERAKGHEFMVLAAIFQHSPSGLLALRTSGIRDPHDIVGKTIMLSPRGEPDIWAMLRAEGVTPDCFTLAEPTWDLDDLKSGEVDAMAAYMTNTPFLLSQQGIPYTLIRPLTYGVDFYGDGLFAAESTVRNRPEVTARFIEASLKGWEYAMTHPQETINLILASYAVHKSRAHLEFEAEAMRELMLPDLVQVGHMNPGRWERMAQVYAELGMIEPGLDLDGFLYSSVQAPETRRWRSAARLALFVSLSAALAALVLFLFNRRLKREVAERTKAQETLRHTADNMRGIFQGLAVPTYIWRVQGEELVFTGFNLAGDEMVKGKANEFLNRTARDIHASRPQIVADLETAFKEKRMVRRTMPYSSRITDLELILNVTATFLEPDVVIMHVEDVTERERAQETLRQAMEQAEAASRLKGEFLAAISHEIRTPMNAILGLSDLLQNSRLDEEQRDWLEALHESARSLLTLINAILDYSKMAGGDQRLDEEPFALPTVVRSAVDPMISLARTKGLALDWHVAADVPELLVGDGPRLKIVLASLLDNAVKFTSEGGVLLEIRREADQPDQDEDSVILRFTVTDSGIGIAAKDQARIFETFVQADGALSRQYNGTGLGLTISRRIVELMGGSLTVTSTLGKGSEFSFSARFPMLEKGAA